MESGRELGWGRVGVSACNGLATYVVWRLTRMYSNIYVDVILIIITIDIITVIIIMIARAVSE